MKRNKHNLSHYNLLTCDMGQIVPLGVVEALPGDTVQHHVNVLARVSPLAAPVMHPVTARVHHFFVPNRLLWDAEKTGDPSLSTWENFITGGDDGNNADTPPTIDLGASAGQEKTLSDYMGIPPTTDLQVNALPFRAFNMIYNEFYRDQDLATKRELDDVTVPNCAWEKDYFTSARPWTQKGDDVTLPLGDRAPVTGIGRANQDGYVAANNLYETGGTTNDTDYAGAANPDGADGWKFAEDPDNPGFPGIYADLSAAVGGDINDIRKAFAIQRYQEARARYGSRYTEYLRYLGVNPSDARLQRPEYLGGGHTQINFSEVLQTAPEQVGQQPTTEFGVGDMYGHGVAAMRSNKYRRFIEEHGYIISCLSVRPKSMYTNGLHRLWLRQDKEDYFQKELQHIGQQEVLNSEVYADSSPAGRETFGYQDRYMDYREVPSHVSAEFRNILNYWHMGREFQAPPVLNQSFIDCVPTKRIHNEQEHHALWIMAQHKMMARRIVSRNAAPRIF